MSVEALVAGNPLGIFMAVQALGLSLWLSIAVLNNWQAFRSSVGAVGATMAMEPLRLPLSHAHLGLNGEAELVDTRPLGERIVEFIRRLPAA